MYAIGENARFGPDSRVLRRIAEYLITQIPEIYRFILKK
jgi:hypothetical protein